MILGSVKPATKLQEPIVKYANMQKFTLMDCPFPVWFVEKLSGQDKVFLSTNFRNINNNKHPPRFINTYLILLITGPGILWFHIKPLSTENINHTWPGIIPNSRPCFWPEAWQFCKIQLTQCGFDNSLNNWLPIICPNYFFVSYFLALRFWFYSLLIHIPRGEMNLMNQKNASVSLD